MVTVYDLPSYLRKAFPECADVVAEIEHDDPDASVNLYSYISEAFWWGVFQPSIVNRDWHSIAKCFTAVEDFLASTDSRLRAAAGIRVTPYLLDPTLEDMVSRYAGPYLKADMLRERGI